MRKERQRGERAMSDWVLAFLEKKQQPLLTDRAEICATQNIALMGKQRTNKRKH